MNTFKPTSVGQYMIYQWVCKNFYLDYITLQALNKYSILLESDSERQAQGHCAGLLIQYINGEIRYFTWLDSITKKAILLTIVKWFRCQGQNADSKKI